MRILRAIVLLLALGAGAIAAGEADRAKRMVVLGVDGLDPTLLADLMRENRLPNLSALAKTGGFIALGTSIPPQSPVAWSNFITGVDPGGHGLFDFLGLDRQTMVPYLSAVRIEKGWLAPLQLGGWRLPLTPDKPVRQRDQQAFWELLDEAGIPTTVFRMPANYPPVATGGRTLSGMGTPDLRGTPGTFSFYTSDPNERTRRVSGGVIQRIELMDGVARASIEGPPNAFLEGAPFATEDFTVYVDPHHPVAGLEIGGLRIVLNHGEWSDWVRLEFELVPGLVRVPGMVRFFLRGTSPHLDLYASPVNIDPRRPAQPISNPAGYASELAGAVGPFYTQEMPEDTKALSAGVLDARLVPRAVGLGAGRAAPAAAP